MEEQVKKQKREKKPRKKYSYNKATINVSKELHAELLATAGTQKFYSFVETTIRRGLVK